MFQRVVQKTRKICAELNYEKNKQRMRKNLYNHNFSILSANCLGGIIYHDLGEKFMSPTVNLYMSSGDFVTLACNLDSYLRKELKEIKRDLPYPVGGLGEIELHFVHYKSFEEAVNKWEERKNRIDKNNLFLLLTDRDDFSEEILEKYAKLDYPKVLLSGKKYDYDFCIPCKFIENDHAGQLQLFSNYRGERYLYREIDVVQWLNEKKINR